MIPRRVGFLSEAEAQQLPPPQQMTTGIAGGRPTNVAFNVRVADTNDDGKIDLPELLAYYREYGSIGMRIEPSALTRTMRVSSGAP